MHPAQEELEESVIESDAFYQWVCDTKHSDMEDHWAGVRHFEDDYEDCVDMYIDEYASELVKEFIEKQVPDPDNQD